MSSARAKDLAAKCASQQVQIDRQEQIILSLRDELERRNAEPQSPMPLRPPSRDRQHALAPGVADAQELIAAQTENAKLRELVSLMRQKLAQQ